MPSTTYDAAGRVTQRVLGSNVVQQNYGYYPWTTANGNGRLQQIKAGTPISLTALQDLNYTYDAVGNVLTILDNKAGPQTQTFTYDALDRLQTAQATGGVSGTYPLETYPYDPIGNLQSKPGVGIYTYTASATGCVVGTPAIKPHAVRYAGSYSFTYDCNGNMLTRNDSTGNFTQQWDRENRLITVTGSASGSFVYDGDGNRVKATLNGTTTAYIGNYYEQTGSVTTTYYYAGGARIAMRQGMTVSYLLGDHLGSTAITANSSGGFASELRYKPWGETRYTNGTTPTRHRFTGQIEDSEIGLYFYGARMYSPASGRFLSADTVVPDPSNPQTLNRYSYVNNRPLNFTDPTGYIDQNQVSDAEDILKKLALYGVEIVVDWGWSVSSKNIWSWNKGLWDVGELNNVLSGVQSLAKAMGGENNFRNNLGGVRVEQKNLTAGGYGQAHYVELDDTGLDEWRVVHEFAHAWDANTGWKLSEQIETFTGGKTVGTDCILWFCRSSQYNFSGIPAKGADANFTRQEDFAESVAAFVYPAEAKQFVKTFYPNEPRYQYDQYYALPRAQFVARQLGVNLGDFTTRHQ